MRIVSRAGGYMTDTLIHPDHELTIGDQGIVLRRDTPRELHGFMTMLAGVVVLFSLMLTAAAWPRTLPHPEGIDASVGMGVFMLQALAMYGPVLKAVGMFAGGLAIAAFYLIIARAPEAEWRVDRTTITCTERRGKWTRHRAWSVNTVVRARPFSLYRRGRFEHSVRLRLIDNRSLAMPVDTAEQAEALARAIRRMGANVR